MFSGKQVDKELYHKDSYDHLGRFTSYYYQIRSVLDLDVESVLEIGIGNKTVFNYLKQAGLKVTSGDFDKDLEPDVVCDVRDMKGVKDNSFDLVMACEVLEHLPWEEVDLALKELHRVSKRYVLVSVPWSAWPVGVSFQIPNFFSSKGYSTVDLGFVLPRFYARTKWRGEHYWEIGSKGYPLRKVRSKFTEDFSLVKEFQNPHHRIHHYFVLEKK
jgi:ubiquinone/menaquinone biosynthesis C-methylase UbiE